MLEHVFMHASACMCISVSMPLPVPIHVYLGVCRQPTYVYKEDWGKYYFGVNHKRSGG